MNICPVIPPQLCGCNLISYTRIVVFCHWNLVLPLQGRYRDTEAISAISSCRGAIENIRMGNFSTEQAADFL